MFCIEELIYYAVTCLQVCKDRRCKDASFTELHTCIARCHGHGVSGH